MMQLHKSRSLPETNAKISDFEYHLAPPRIEEDSSECASDTRGKNMECEEKTDEAPQRNARKRWKLLQRLTFSAVKHVKSDNKDDFSKKGDKKKRFSFRGITSTESMNETKYGVKSKTIEKDTGTKTSSQKNKKKKMIWGEDDSSFSSSLNEMAGQEINQESDIDELAELPDIPRRKGVCEEIEKHVINEGTSLHELRKDLTVYLTLDELGML
ncbi:uncharacterized protein LOC116607830 [Nematostella vectensis]|uniref:uncharacterized protein LOC116607830 n=1 Tax=Nematostella vectensis TaxID=45351 RepID=UPI00138FD876|nr:uncharacterized protein LOC116607830 [Nematostella vectensis]